MELQSMLPEWIDMPECAVTICDADCKIIFMNRRSRETFAEGTDRLIGANLLDCHSPRSREIIRRLLSEGGSNTYTIRKRGIRKMIYQSRWLTSGGKTGGLIELSMVIPDDMPEYVRE